MNSDIVWREAVEKRLYALEGHKAIGEVHREDILRRLEGIEDTLKRLMWIVVTGILMAAVGYALQGGFLASL